MAFRLKASESVRHGVRRLAAKELRHAREQFGHARRPSDDGIHEARKGMKKARAILQVIEADGGRHLGDARKRFQAVNQVLSPLRDADAMLEVLEELRARAPRLLSEHTFARVRRRLATEKRATLKNALRADRLKKLDRDLRRLRKSAKRWRQEASGFAALAPGIQTAHKRGRKALTRAHKRQRAADFHEWRKAVKALWYALRLLQGRSARIDRDIAALHRAETALGNDHNVVVLCEVLAADPSICRTAADVDRVRLAGDSYQCEMRTQALKAARRIYAAHPRAYVRRIEHDWERSARWDRSRLKTSRTPSTTSRRRSTSSRRSSGS
jgi:CHAD domain-containing protein